jgi:hypothetical protein
MCPGRNGRKRGVTHLAPVQAPDGVAVAGVCTINSVRHGAEVNDRDQARDEAHSQTLAVDAPRLAGRQPFAAVEQRPGAQFASLESLIADP